MMPRSRNLKPGFFKNDLLAETGPLGMLVFEGLWTIADRAGRLEDRPLRIKAEVLPYFDANVDEILSQLADRGFIERYAVNDTRYVQVVNFGKHQTPHIKEPASELPAPGETVATPAPAPDKPDTSTVQEPVEHPLIPDTGYLIPDSGLLIAQNDDEPAAADATDVAEVPTVPDIPAEEPIGEQPADEPPEPTPVTPYILLEVLCDEIGQDPSVLSKRDKGKQLAAAKRLVEDGIGEPQLRKMVHWLAPQTWVINGGGLDLGLIAGQVGKWRLNGEPDGLPIRASPPTRSRTDEVGATVAAFQAIGRGEHRIGR